MKILKFNPKSKSETLEAVNRSIEVLKKGGIIVHPTDTCYGIAADMHSQKGIKRVYQFKGRDFKNPLFIIVPNITQFKKYGRWNSLAQEMVKKNPKKMYTFVVARKKTVPSHLNPDFETVGIQMPKCLFSQVLLRKNRSPVIGTSANISNQPVVYSVQGLLKQLKSAKRYPDLILDAGKLQIKKPSSVVALKGRNIEILRK